MSGFLSNMFGADQGQAPASSQSPEAAADAGGNGGDPGEGSSESSSQSTGIDGDGSVNVDEGVELSREGSYEGADGSQHEWSQSNEVGVQGDSAALVSSTHGITDEASDLG